MGGGASLLHSHDRRQRLTDARQAALRRAQPSPYRVRVAVSNSASCFW